jgi:aspartate/methionine/tyrosine aminotransferase
MKHTSMYLDWYVHAAELKYDLRSSGIAGFKYDLTLGEVDLSLNYAHGNMETTKLLAQRYNVQPENVFISSEGASGQNARIIRCLAERNPGKNEAIIEYPTYEPLLRLVQEYFPYVKRLERKEENAYTVDADLLKKATSDKTGLLVMTNPHAPSGAVSVSSELEEIMDIARERGFYVLCDEIYAEFDRTAVPTIFSADSKLGIVTTSLTKAYGLGGLKLGIALADSTLVDGTYTDVLNTVGNSPNLVQLAAVELLTKGRESLERHRQKWTRLKSETEKWLNEEGLEYWPNRVSVTYWVKLPIPDTYGWVNEHTIKHHSLAVVPGAFFLFREGYELSKSSMVRLGLGNVNPDKPNLGEALKVLEKALNAHDSAKAG